jgi:hypothetical protein
VATLLPNTIFPGNTTFFNFILGAIMVPSTALVLPLFLMLYRLGLVNTIWGVILPSLVNPFGLYLMRVFWNASFPNELIEPKGSAGFGTWEQNTPAVRRVRRLRRPEITPDIYAPCGPLGSIPRVLVG